MFLSLGRSCSGLYNGSGWFLLGAWLQGPRGWRATSQALSPGYGGSGQPGGSTGLWGGSQMASGPWGPRSGWGS